MIKIHVKVPGAQPDGQMLTKGCYIRPAEHRQKQKSLAAALSVSPTKG